MELSIEGGTIGTSAPYIVLPNVSGVRSKAVLVPVRRLLIAESHTDSTIGDVIVRHTVPATYAYDYKITFDYVDSPDIAYDALGTADVIGGVLTYDLDDDVDLLIYVGGVLSQTLTVAMRSFKEPDYDRVVAWAVGSVGQVVSDYTDSLLVGTHAKEVFSLQDHGTPAYVRNSNCWAWPVRAYMTCISPWNSRSSTQRAGTAITPRHIVQAQHFRFEVGDVVRFVTADNVVVDRTVVSTVNVYWPDGTMPIGVATTDVQIAQLDSDLPGTIVPCSMFNLDANGSLPYLPDPAISYFNGANVPCMALDQEEKALVFDLLRLTTSAFFDRPFSTLRNAYTEEIIGGDSGDPVFMVHPDALILLTTWTTGGFNPTGDSYTFLKNKFQECIDALCGAAGISPALYQIRTFIPPV